MSAESIPLSQLPVVVVDAAPVAAVQTGVLSNKRTARPWEKLEEAVRLEKLPPKSKGSKPLHSLLSKLRVLF